jgi:ATP synthase protein I
MLANYARILRRSAAVTAAAAAVMVALSAAIGGAKGALGALLGAALVAAFFAVSVLAIAAAARVSPQVLMVTVMTTYVAKILVLLFFVVRFSGSTAFNPKLFGLTAIVCILVWSASQVTWSLRLKVPYVEPDGER